MTTSRADHAYHHGNLPEALLDAVADIVDQRGVDAVSVRAAARHVGVSHTAPMHHFGDKRGLLTAFAVRGFRRFTRALQASGRDDDPEQALRECGAAYVRFASTDTAYFNVMFRPELLDHDDPELSAAGDNAFGVLLDRVARCLEAGDADDPETYRLALYAWAMVHGIAELFVDGPMSKESELTINAAYDLVASVMIAGMRAQPGWRSTASGTG
ncbi:MAG TPA: TetR/AcrR family transcriptional regulator [Euzebyales bacterium]